MTTSTLAAVVAAAAGGDGAAAPALSASPTLESLMAEHPALYAAVVAEGATAERVRIAGIEAQAMPGHEAIITAHKADGTKSGADTAMAIITAEKATRSGQLSALAEDEKAVKGLRNAPLATANDRNDGDDKPTVAQLKDRAASHIAEQAAKGITVSAAKAVAFVSKQ